MAGIGPRNHRPSDLNSNMLATMPLGPHHVVGVATNLHCFVVSLIKKLYSCTLSLTVYIQMSKWVLVNHKSNLPKTQVVSPW